MPDRLLVGWDIGGAHVKACLMRGARVYDAAQWACPLWQGLEHLERALTAARARWPLLRAGRDGVAGPRHAITMTGEMADLFPTRAAGVQAIAAQMERSLGSALHFYAGAQGWCGAGEVGERWAQIASANWRATASHAARRVREGMLVDIGSTTTDLIALRGGRVASEAQSDAERLVSGELVYHGVVRTPLCAVAPRMVFRGQMHNVMHEFFATSADVYRLTGELDPAHDLYPAADGAAKDLPATRQRLARMIGRDAPEAADDDWAAFGQAWRAAQLAEISGQFERVAARHGVPARAPVVVAGCGDFLAAALAKASGRPWLAYGSDVARIASEATADVARCAQVAAPAVAVAALLDDDLNQEQR